MQKRINWIWVVVVAMLAFTAGIYFARDQRVAKVVPMNPSWPQNALVYVNKKTQHDRLLPKQQQNQAAVYSLGRFFAPWDDYSNARLDNVLHYEYQSLKHVRAVKQYGINFHAYGKRFWQAILANMDLAGFPNRNQRGMVVKNAGLRLVPTDLPAFVDAPNQITYPFDSFAMSPVWVGQPIRILQQSKDGAWYLASVNGIAGWIQRDAFALVDQAYVDGYKNNAFVAITQDNVPVKNNTGEFLFYSRIGSIYPWRNQQVMVPAANGKLTVAQLPQTAYTPYPLKITEYNLAQLMNHMMGEPYTWGLNNYRECSLTLKNLFMAVGIWLPKHSQKQLKLLPYIDLSQMTDQQKLRVIQQKAQPFLTILGTPGHVTLYVGHYKNHEMVFQDHWGYHTRDLFGDTGRLVIGKTIIDSLIPAEQDKQPSMQNDLLDELSKMTSLAGYPKAIKSDG